LLLAQSQNASDAEAYAKQGIAFRKQGKLAEAAESFERSVRLQPEPRVQVLLAFTYMDSGRHQDAIPLLASSFEKEEKDSVKSVIGQRLLECYLATGAEDQALPVVQKLRQLAPHDPNVLYLSSKVYMNLWNSAFRLMLEKAPGSYQVHLIQAEALEAQGRFADAAQAYREVLKVAPSLTGIHFRLGHALLRSNSTSQEALEEFRRELALSPSHAGALTELAKALIAQKQWSQALDHLETAARLAPDDEAIQYNLMLAYRGLGRTEDAKRAFDNFQRLKEQKKK
jgi:tetratricopeptide (TPR) repeat protein